CDHPHPVLLLTPYFNPVSQNSSKALSQLRSAWIFDTFWINTSLGMGFSSNSCNASDQALTFRAGTTLPSWGPETNSAGPPSSETRTGRPEAVASITTFPNVSVVLGNMKISPDA